MTKEEQNFKIFLEKKPYYPLNKVMIQIIGSEGAVFLTDLIETYFFLQENNLIEKKGWFSKTFEYRKKCTGISFHRQNEIIKDLKKRGFLEIEKWGKDARIHFRINFKTIKKSILGFQNLILKFQKPKANQGHNAQLLIYNNILLYNIINRTLYPSSSPQNSFFINKKEINGCFSNNPSTLLSKNKKNKFVEYWNNIKHVKGKHKDSITKIYHEVAKKFKRIRGGTFLKHYPLHPEFLNQRGINKSDLLKKWSDKKIKEGLNELSKIFLPEYWPVDKSKIPKSLNNLLYNPMTRKSFFFLASLKGIGKIEINTEIESCDYKEYLETAISNICVIKKIKTSKAKKEELVNQYSKKIPGYVKIFEQIIDVELNKFSKIKLAHNVIDLLYYFEITDRNSNKNSSFNHFMGYSSSIGRVKEVDIGDPSKFIKLYIKWLKKKYSSKSYSIKPNTIGPKSNNWNDFCLFLEDGYGFDLKTTRKVKD